MNINGNFKVGIIEDFFRNEENKVASVSRNQEFLLNNLKILSNEIGFEVKKVSAKFLGGNIDSQKILSDMGLKGESFSSWVSAYSNKRILQTKHLDILSSYDLILGFGIPPSLIFFMNEKGISFIDFELSPYRFLDSLTLSVRTNNPIFLKQIDQIKIKTSYLVSKAQEMSNYFSSLSYEKYIRRQNSSKNAVFFTQTRHDASLIMDGIIYNPSSEDIFDYIYKEFKKFDNVFISVHPLEKDLTEAKKIISGISNSILSRNISYSYFFDNQISKFYSLSSSLLAELELFHKNKGLRLIAPDIHFSSLLKDTSNLRTVDNKIFSLEFWENILTKSDHTYDKGFEGVQKEFFGWNVNNFKKEVIRYPMLVSKGDYLGPQEIYNSSSFGWHSNEENWIWGKEEISSINLRFKEYKKYKLRIYISKFNEKNEHNEFEVKFRINNQNDLYIVKISKLKNKRFFDIDISAKQSKNDISITLICDDISKPKNDTRVLSYKIVGIDII